MHYLLIALKLTVALGILNVWLLRSGKATAYRGKDAKTLREEFAVYGLPFPVFCLIGILKVGLALGAPGLVLDSQSGATCGAWHGSCSCWGPSSCTSK
ncbi:MAG: hypothetical protein V9G29_04520 [Burkholderiaceae bacterium]